MTGRDRADIEKVARILVREQNRPIQKVRDYLARGSEGLPYRRVCSILRRYGAEVAEAGGFKRVRYWGAEYHASGAGAFGRLGGGLRGRYDAPRITLER